MKVYTVSYYCGVRGVKGVTRVVSTQVSATSAQEARQFADMNIKTEFPNYIGFTWLRTVEA